MAELSPRTQAALQYLRRLKPLDGFSVEKYIASSGKSQVRLKRRNIPVSDEGFEEIVVDRKTGCCVGIQISTSRGDAGRGIILVDKNGKLANDDKKIVTVDMVNVSTTSSIGSQMSGTASRTSSSSTARTTTARPRVNDDTANNELLIQYGLMVLGALILLKILYAALNILSILVLPIIYLYASANCPSHDTFDAKKELKRVMRGAHLPEECQPKGFFEQGFNRLAASVTTELATSLGYEIQQTDYFGACRLACVKVPAASYEYYWIGLMNKWRYIGQREIPGRKND